MEIQMQQSSSFNSNLSTSLNLSPDLNVSKSSDNSTAGDAIGSKANSDLNSDVNKKIEQLNHVLTVQGSNCKYQLVIENGHSIVQLKDGDQVLFQSPPEGLVQFAAKANQFVGLLIDQKR